MRLTSIRVWSASALFVLAAGTAFGQSSSSQASAAGDEQGVKAAQQQLLQAAQQGNKDDVGRLLADDMTWVMGNGKVSGKAEFLDTLSSPPRDVDVEQIRPFGKIALVTGVAHFEEGQDARFLQEWVNQDGQWKLMAHEGTLIGAPSSAAPTGTSGTAGKAAASAMTGRSVAPTLNSGDERAIWKVSEELRRAFLKGDAVEYGKLTTDDYIRVGADGKLYGKNDFLETVKQNAGKSGGRLESSDVQITVNGDTARVIQTVWGTLPGGEQTPPTRMTRIYEKRNGQWQQAGVAFVSIREQ